MKEKIDALYQEYLKNKLDLIFKFEKKIGISVSGVGRNGKYDYVDVEEKMVSEYLGDKDYAFIEGFVCVEKDRKYNFINVNGNLISDIWYDNVYAFNKGFSIVEENGKYNFINTRGELISDVWYENELFFHNGFSKVKKDEKWNYINTRGELISDVWKDEISDFNEIIYGSLKMYDLCYYLGDNNRIRYSCDSHGDFHEGFVSISKNNKWNFINIREELVSDVWYDRVMDFHNGFAWVKQEAKWNYINTSGNLISDVWYEDVLEVNENLTRIRKNGLFNFMNSHKELTSDIWYDSVGEFKNNFASVMTNNKYNFLNSNGQLIGNIWYDSIRSFDNGFAMVKNNGKWNYINTSGNLISDVWYDAVENFYDGYAWCQKGNDYYLIDTDGRVLYKSKFKRDVKSISNFLLIGKSIFNKDIDMGTYDVKKTLFGYICSNSHDTYKVKYNPVKRFGFRYTLCVNENNLILYDRVSNEYDCLGDIGDISYNDNFIFDKKNDKVYLVYENQIIEITEYYKSNFANVCKIDICSGITGILSREEFSLKSMSEIDKLMEEEKVKNKFIKETRKKIEDEKKQNEELEKIKKQQEMLEQKNKEDELRALKNIQSSLTILQKIYSSGHNSTTRAKIDNIFIQVGDHLEIIPIIIGALKFFDLSIVNFKNVKVNGIDFRNCNIDINPQIVYQKDLSNCNFEGVYISPFKNFSGVDIRGARFSYDNDSKTRDMFNMTFKDAIYDETTTYNGMSFMEILNKEQIENNRKK